MWGTNKWVGYTYIYTSDHQRMKEQISKNMFVENQQTINIMTCPSFQHWNVFTRLCVDTCQHVDEVHVTITQMILLTELISKAYLRKYQRYHSDRGEKNKCGWTWPNTTSIWDFTMWLTVTLAQATVIWMHRFRCFKHSASGNVMSILSWNLETDRKWLRRDPKSWHMHGTCDRRLICFLNEVLALLYLESWTFHFERTPICNEGKELAFFSLTWGVHTALKSMGFVMKSSIFLDAICASWILMAYCADTCNSMPEIKSPEESSC